MRTVLRVPYTPDSKIYREHYGAGIPVFRGMRYQRGSGMPVFRGRMYQVGQGFGLGRIFKSMKSAIPLVGRSIKNAFKTAMKKAKPLLAKGVKKYGKHALKMGKNVIQDVLAGDKDVQSSFISRGNEMRDGMRHQLIEDLTSGEQRNDVARRKRQDVHDQTVQRGRRKGGKRKRYTGNSQD